MYDFGVSIRIDIRVPEDTLERIDAEAAERKMTRTAVLIERWNESRAVEPHAPARTQGGHGAQGEPGDGALSESPMKHPLCAHGRAKILKLKTCSECGARV